MFTQHARRERAERFAKLDLDVHLLLHPRRARVADDAAAAKRARAELHPSLEPSDDLLLRHQPGHAVQECFLVGDALVCGAHAVEEQADVVVRKSGAEERAMLRIGRPGGRDSSRW